MRETPLAQGFPVSSGVFSESQVAQNRGEMHSQWMSTRCWAGFWQEIFTHLCPCHSPNMISTYFIDKETEIQGNKAGMWQNQSLSPGITTPILYRSPSKPECWLTFSKPYSCWIEIQRCSASSMVATIGPWTSGAVKTKGLAFYQEGKTED